MGAPDPAFEYVLRLGDACLILSHRLSEWIGHAPALEEDLALGNVGLDLIGQARLWLNLAGEIEGRGRDADKLAHMRDAGGYRNFLLVEQPNGDFAVTMARQYFFDVWHRLTLNALQTSGDPRISAIAAKALREVTYHAVRSREWMLRLGDGTQESHTRMQAAVEELWPYTGEMLEADDIDRAMQARGLAPDAAALRAPWLDEVAAVLREATLVQPASGWMQRGGKSGAHSEHLGFILAQTQFLQRTYPGAAW